MSKKLLGAFAVLVVLVALGLLMNSSDDAEEEFIPYRDELEPTAPAAPSLPEPKPTPTPPTPVSAESPKTPKPAPQGSDSPAAQMLNSTGPSDVVAKSEIPADQLGDTEAFTGRVDKESIQRGIRSMTPVFQACYESALEDFPGQEGKVVLQFDITAADGKGRIDLTEVDDSKTTLFDTKLHDCMQSTLGEVTFEVPEGSGKVHVSYPFAFRSDAEDIEKD